MSTVEQTTSRPAPLDPSTAAPQSAEILRARERQRGQTWNVTRVLANAPAVLAMMDAAMGCLARSSLSAADRELIAMELAVANGCHYCVPAHRYIAHREAKFDSETLDLLQQVSRGETLAAGTRLGMMQRLVRRLLATRGGLSDEEFESFAAAGVTPQQMIETVAEIAQATVLNFTNRLARTPLDPFLNDYR